MSNQGSAGQVEVTMRYGVLFPGQGSQFVGMGAEFFETREDLLGERVEQILGWSLRDACLFGSDDSLTRTDRAQPALYAVSYAMWEALSARIPIAPAGAAGHSLGEYTARAAAGAFTYEDGLRLVAERGEAMAQAATRHPSGMAALLGATPSQAETVAAERRNAGGELWVANLNGPGQVVVAGGAADISWVGANAKALGLRRAVPLQVAGAFHSPFMEPASARLEQALSQIDMGPGDFPVWSNVTAAPVGKDEWISSLATQIVAPVRFAESLESMAAAGIDVFVHVGPGEVTGGLARRTVPNAEVLVVNDLETLDATAAVLEERLTMTRPPIRG